MIGSGNFGTALVRLLGRNAKRHDAFDDEVRMFVYEEQVDGQNLTDIINTKHVNVKYLPEGPLTPNVVAVPDLAEAARGATMIVFCTPHQFLKPMIKTVKPVLGPNYKALSAVKGIDFDDKGIVLISDLIRQELGCDTSILMGANVANEMASDSVRGAVRERAASGRPAHAWSDPPPARAVLRDDDRLLGQGERRPLQARLRRPGLQGWARERHGRRRALRRAQKHRRDWRGLLRRAQVRREHQGGDHPNRSQGDEELLQHLLQGHRRASRAAAPRRRRHSVPRTRPGAHSHEMRPPARSPRRTTRSSSRAASRTSSPPATAAATASAPRRTRRRAAPRRSTTSSGRSSRGRSCRARSRPRRCTTCSR